MAEIIPTSTDSTTSRIGLFWGSSPLINGGQTPKSMLCNSLPKVHEPKNNVKNEQLKKSNSLPAITHTSSKDLSSDEKKTIKKSTSSNTFLTAVATGEPTPQNTGPKKRRGRAKKPKIRMLSMVEEQAEAENMHDSDSDADSWFSDLSSDDEERIYCASHPELEDENISASSRIKSTFVGEHAKETFFKSIGDANATKNKVHLPSTMRYDWNSKKIMKCTGIMNIPPLTPRFKYISACQKAHYVPEPILIRRKEHEMSLPLQHLGLSRGKFGLLMDTLTNFTNIQELNLRGNSLSSRSIETLLKTMQPSNSCTSIDLSYNTMGVQAMKSLAELLSQGNLTTIRLVNCKVSNKCVEAFYNVLASKNKRKINVTSLDIQRNEFGNASKLLQSCPKLVDLNLAFNNVKTEDGIEIAKLLSESSSKLQRVSFYLCPLVLPYAPPPDWWDKPKETKVNDEGEEIVVEIEEDSPSSSKEKIENDFFERFASMLSKNTTLEDIDLSNTNFWKLSCLCDAIIINKTLRHLSLSNNAIPKSEIKPFSEAMKSNHTIEGIHIMIGNAAAVDNLGFIRPLQGIRTINKVMYDVHDFQENGAIVENCWVCEMWQEIKFTWIPGISGSGGKDISVCLNVDHWTPQRMKLNKATGEYELFRALPPKKIKFFFSIAGGLEFSSLHPTMDMQIWPFGPKLTVNVIDVPKRDDRHTVRFCHVAPRPNKPGSFDKSKNDKFVISDSVFAPRFRRGTHLDQKSSVKACVMDVSRVCNLVGISKLVKDEVLCSKIKKNLEKNYARLCSIFKKYCVVGSGATNQLQKNAFSQLLKDCGVLETSEINVLDSLGSKALRISDCDLIFTTSNYMSKETKDKLPRMRDGTVFIGTRHALMRYQFIEALIRIALAIEKVYSKRKDLEDTLTVASVFETLIEKHLLEFGHKSTGDSFRTAFIYESKSDGLLREHLLELKTIFRKLNKRNNTTAQSGMALIDFLDLSYNCFSKTLKEDAPKNSSTLVDGLTVQKLTQIYLDSKVLEADEICSPHTLDFMDFLETLCRIGDARVKKDMRSVVAINVREHMQGQNGDQFRNRRGSWLQVQSFVKNRELLVEKTGKFAKLERAKLLQHTLQKRHSMEHVPSFESQLRDEEVQEFLDNKRLEAREPVEQSPVEQALESPAENDKGIEGKEGDEDDTSAQNFSVPEMCRLQRNASAESGSDTCIGLVWENIAEDKSGKFAGATYDVQYKELGAVHWHNAFESIETAECVVEALNPDTKYEFRVRGIVSGLQGNFSDPIILQTHDARSKDINSEFHQSLVWVIDRICKRYA